MKKAAVAVDNWKLKYFKKGIKKAGYEIEEELPLTKETTILTVKYEDKDFKEFHFLIKSLNSKVSRRKK